VSGGGVVDVRDVVLDLFFVYICVVVTPVASLEVDFGMSVLVSTPKASLSRFLVNVVECFSLIRVE
jgi:hypothetical protein